MRKGNFDEIQTTNYLYKDYIFYKKNALMLSNRLNEPSYSTLDVNEFVIPDEPVENDGSKGQNGRKEPSKPQNPSLGSLNPFGLFPWGTTVDLSTAFTPLTNNEEFQKKNIVKERQYTGGDTLDEPVWHTLKRDLVLIFKRLLIVIWPMQLAQLAAQQQLKLVRLARSNGIDIPPLVLDPDTNTNDNTDLEGASENAQLQGTLEWDLWGPLIFSLAYSVTLGFSSSKDQTNSVFSGSFALMWIFFVVVGLNIQLLGGNISFMSAISATGYSMFPIVCGCVVFSLVIKWRFVRILIMLVLYFWSIFAGTMSLKCSGVLPGRVTLAMYPVGLLYSVLAWLSIIISKEGFVSDLVDSNPNIQYYNCLILKKALRLK